MRYLYICLAAAMILAACGVPESPAASQPLQEAQTAAAPSAEPTTAAVPSAEPTTAAVPSAEPTTAAAPSPPPTATQEATMSEDPSPTPTAARQFQAQPASPAVATPATTPAGVPIVPPYDVSMQRYLQIAVGDLAAQLKIDQAAIEVAAVSSVIWPNSGLGCERAGMMYKQVPVDGYLIELRVSGQIYRYHGGGSREPFLCTSPSVGAPGGDLSR